MLKICSLKLVCEPDHVTRKEFAAALDLKFKIPQAVCIN